MRRTAKEPTRAEVTADIAHIKARAAALGRPLSGAETALLRYLGLVEHRGAWALPDPGWLDQLAEGLAGRYPGRRVLPLLKCNGNDDVLCLSIHDPESPARFIIVHDWASAGWEVTLRTGSLSEAVALHRGWFEDLPLGLEA